MDLHFSCFVFSSTRDKKLRMKTEKKEENMLVVREEISRATPPPMSISWCTMDLFGCAVKRGIFIFIFFLIFCFGVSVLNLALFALYSLSAFSYASMCMVLKILSLIPIRHMNITCTPPNCSFYIHLLNKNEETWLFQNINQQHLYPSFFVFLSYTTIGYATNCGLVINY